MAAPDPLSAEWPDRAAAILRAQPELATERLQLRRLRADDAEAVFAYARDEEVARFTSWPPHASIEDSRAFLAGVLAGYEAGASANWAIEERATGRFAGTIGLGLTPEHRSAECGYVIARDLWGRGYATEALTAAVAFAFDAVGVHRIVARCVPENTASWKVLQKVGLRSEGVAREVFHTKGVFMDLMIWAMLRTDRK